MSYVCKCISSNFNLFGKIFVHVSSNVYTKFYVVCKIVVVVCRCVVNDNLTRAMTSLTFSSFYASAILATCVLHRKLSFV